MSMYAKNCQCDMCREVEKNLCRINVGKIDHMICYDCMAKLTVDLVEFASMNCVDELEQMGVDIEIKKKTTGNPWSFECEITQSSETEPAEPKPERSTW